MRKPAALFPLVISLICLAQSARANTEWFYEVHGALKPKGLTVSHFKELGDAGDYISAKQFCFSLSCKLVYQWSISRAVISHRTEKRNAILNRFLHHVLINGNVYKLSAPILADSKEGYLIPMNLAMVLARELNLGKIWFEGKATPQPIKKAEVPAGPHLKSIVIDPGHGGIDMGTSSSGIFEKDVALIYAIRLKEMVEHAMPHLNVTLTRSEDEFVSLADRARLANSKNAQIFISLHLNHAGNAKIEGEETYILSPDATDNDARKLALMENETWLKSAQLSGAKASSNNMVNKILVDMEQTKFIQSSAYLAALINQELKPLDRHRGLKTRGVKQAMFYVLSQVAMPSVLLEMGFLSNSGDRGRLMDVKFRDEFANSIVTALKRYEQNAELQALAQ